MTPEIAGFVVIVFLFMLLLAGLLVRAQLRKVDREEMEKLAKDFRALEGKRDALPSNVEQADDAVISFVRKLNALSSRESEECPRCGAHVEAMEEVGRSVYSRPCGCRQFQGHVPQAWLQES